MAGPGALLAHPLDNVIHQAIQFARGDVFRRADLDCILLDLPAYRLLEPLVARDLNGQRDGPVGHVAHDFGGVWRVSTGPAVTGEDAANPVGLIQARRLVGLNWSNRAADPHPPDHRAVFGLGKLIDGVIQLADRRSARRCRPQVFRVC
jgi:hypothetical protein